MGWFDGFPFVSKEERERRRKDFEKRIAPFGVEEQREKLKVTLAELFPKVDSTEAMFAFFDAKDAYTSKDEKELGEHAARIRMRRQKWLDEKKSAIMLCFIEMETGISSLDEYPTAADVLKALPE